MDSVEFCLETVFFFSNRRKSAHLLVDLTTIKSWFTGHQAVCKSKVISDWLIETHRQKDYVFHYIFCVVSMCRSKHFLYTWCLVITF